MFIKYGMRCLASTTRTSDGVRAFFIQDSGLGQIVELLAYVRDEEAQANCAKVVRVCLRDDLVSMFAYNFLKNHDTVTTTFPSLGDLLLKNCATFIFGEHALIELLACFRSFTRISSKL